MSSSFYIFILISLGLTSMIKGDAGLIRKTCKTTKYYNLCVSTLDSNPTSMNSDAKGLTMILIGVAMANASATSTFLSSQVVSITNDTILKEVLKECSIKYAHTVNALRASVQDLASESYNYSYMHVMAAADYPNACHNAFRRHSRLIYPQEIARREDGLKRICDVVLEIIDHIGF